MKRLSKFKYPKIGMLLICTALAYWFFSNSIGKNILNQLNLDSYIGNFLVGITFSFGFTTPFAIGALILMSPDNILLTSLIGGFGAMVADLTIFKIVEISFLDEFKKLMKNKTFRKISKHSPTLSTRIKNYLLYSFAGIIIASPLPDELGVSLLAGITRIKPFPLALISFICNSIGIYLILLI